jgi:hypothetical protein
MAATFTPMSGRSGWHERAFARIRARCARCATGAARGRRAAGRFFHCQTAPWKYSYMLGVLCRRFGMPYHP